jgi:hypothetical protein
MAASTALPPAFKTSIAASVAGGDDVAAMALAATAQERPGLSKFRMGGRISLNHVASGVSHC